MFYHVPYAMDNIAKWYDAAVTDNSDTVRQKWVHLAHESRLQAERLMNRYDIKEVLNVGGQPYSEVMDMFEDIERGVLQVSTEHSEHPVFSVEDNFYFRIWHDLAHFQAFADYTYTGEVKTYVAQAAHLEELSQYPFAGVRHALFVEVLGQAASAVVNGIFNEQKIF